MELPCRAPGDKLLWPGSYCGIRARLCAKVPKHDLATAIACEFDGRSRMVPFIYADLWMPLTVLAVGKEKPIAPRTADLLRLHRLPR